jgi:hypothetical protein
VSLDTDQYYDGDETGSSSAQRSQSRSKLIIGFGLIASAFLGLTFAASISLNGGKSEFGQGIYQIGSCDQWIGISLAPSAASYGGESRVGNIGISGLDATRCRGINFKIQLYSVSAPTTAMPLFTDGSGSVDRLLLSISSDTNKTRSNAVSFINGSGALIAANTNANGSGYAYDGYEYLSYATSSGMYTIAFIQPLATMSLVNNVTVQSASQ